jgi:hypothetical protein
LIDGSLLNEFIPTFNDEKTWAKGQFQFVKKVFHMHWYFEEPVTDMKPQFQA